MSIIERPLAERSLTYVWRAVCPLERLTPDRGVAAVVDGHAVAVFRLRDGSLHAIDDLDPCSGASVLSRGLVGDVWVRVHDVHVIDGVVHVRLAP